MLLQNIQALAGKYEQAMIAVRRHIHQHPELSYQEHNTAAYVREKLTAFGIESRPIGHTGVTAMLHGNNPEKRIVALRADMDALPIQEANEVEYRSQNDGVMHACGHDVHTTCLLGAARILNELKEEWEGSVKLVFQPGEEKNPGGASILIKEGILKDPKPEAIFGLHVHPGMEVGQFSFRAGKVMASADEIYITIKSNGGHAAAPQHTVDTIFAASQLVIALQQLISRRNDPLNPSVLTITAFNGGHTTNVIPAEVKLMGTFRAMDEDWRFRAHEIIEDICKGMEKTTAAQINLKIDVGYPYLVNDHELTTMAIRKAAILAGGENISETELRMGAEDFAYYSHQIPACFFRLGTGNKAKGITSGVHTATFNIDEQAIAHGMAMMAWLGVGRE